jgi:hypothetical protein
VDWRIGWCVQRILLVKAVSLLFACLVSMLACMWSFCVLELACSSGKVTCALENWLVCPNVLFVKAAALLFAWFVVIFDCMHVLDLACGSREVTCALENWLAGGSKYPACLSCVPLLSSFVLCDFYSWCACMRLRKFVHVM